MKVLLGIGGSDDAMRALDRTVARARGCGDDLTVAVVDNPESPRSPGAVEGAVADRLAADDVSADVRRVEGHAGSELVDIAESEGFDELVLGGGTRSPMGKIQVGDIAEFVVLNADLTVTLVR